MEEYQSDPHRVDEEFEDTADRHKAVNIRSCVFRVLAPRPLRSPQSLCRGGDSCRVCVRYLSTRWTDPGSFSCIDKISGFKQEQDSDVVDMYEMILPRREAAPAHRKSQAIAEVWV